MANGSAVNHLRAWTKRDLITLKAAAKRGSVAAAAAKLGRTEAATQQKAMRIGVSFR